jgi:hypothetical protein
MASTLALDSIVSRQPDLLTSLVTDEIVMFDMSKGNYYGLESIGTWIWQRLEGPCSVSALCDALVDRYDVDLPTCRGEVLEFLDGLHREGLILVRDSA